MNIQDIINRVLKGDCIDILDQLPPGFVHCVVTSPPYWALRDYGKAVISHFPEITFSLFGMPITVAAWSGQLGHEPDPMMFTAHIVHVFRKVNRVLRKDGTLWMNFGDSYYGGKGSNGQSYVNQKQDRGQLNKSQHHIGYTRPNDLPSTYLKPKDLCGIPWMVAFALRDDGWYLRQDIIWSKPNPMPESVRDRCTKSHEYLFVFSKSKQYFYDAESIKTLGKNPQDDVRRITTATLDGKSTPDSVKNGIRQQPKAKYAWGKAIDGSISDVRKGNGEAIRKDKQRGHSRRHAGFYDRWDEMTHHEQTSIGANKRSVWEVATKPFTDAHFATYPPELIVDCIKAGCPEYVCSDCGTPFVPVYNRNLVPTSKAARAVVDARDHNADRQDQGSNRAKDGHKPAHIYETKTVGYEKTCKCDWHKPVAGIVLDPFGGSNTTGEVSSKLYRNWVSMEINPEYEPIYTKRTFKAQGLFFTQNTQTP